MNKLLIHSNNTSFSSIERFALPNQFVFDVDADKDVDFYIDEKLNEEGADSLKSKLQKSDIVFIKASLSNNYLEYLGLRLAYHIRLTKSLGQKTNNIPIVFIAEESFQFLGLTCPEPTILFTSGVYLMKEQIDEYEKIERAFANGTIKALNDDHNSFLNTISIKPPANYESHHSTANEWSILRWAKTLGISESSSIRKVKNNIESFLYYKFLQTKYPIQSETNTANFKIDGKGKILYIDDEWRKGWDIVLEKFVSLSHGVTLETLKYDFEHNSNEAILKECEAQIKTSNPDVVLLDLRLADSDFSNTVQPKDLTGIEVLKIIKKINPGTQVIIFTASNKVWNLLELQSSGAEGFILKESPEMILKNESSTEMLQSLSKQITKCISYGYLKEIWMLSDTIKVKFHKNPLTKYFDKDMQRQTDGIKYQNLLLAELNAMFEILKTTNYSRFNMAMIMLHKILEYLNEIFYKKVSRDEYPIFYNGEKVDFFDKKSKSWKRPTDKLNRFNKSTKSNEQIKIKLDSVRSTSNKIINLAVKKLELKDTSILLNLIALSDARNDFMHSDSFQRNKLNKLGAEDIVKWTNSITNIINKL
ncbi:MAG: response regulator [Phycisphaerales bacterium]|nr:response regulator [Phycisphaerales bacterium]